MPSSLLETWAGRAGLTTPAQGPDTVLGWGDMDVSWEVRRAHGRFAVVKTERSASVVGTFSDQDSAEKVLLLHLARLARGREGLPRVEADTAASGTELEEGPASTELRWTGGDAEFAVGRPGRFAAMDASRVVTHSLDSVSRALERPDGGSLFS